jgi:hypothetical protein
MTVIGKAVNEPPPFTVASMNLVNQCFLAIPSSQLLQARSNKRLCK